MAGKVLSPWIGGRIPPKIAFEKHRDALFVEYFQQVGDMFGIGLVNIPTVRGGANYRPGERLVVCDDLRDVP